MNDVFENAGVQIVAMRENHIQRVFEIAERNKLSYWSSADYKAEAARTDSYCVVAENDKKEIVGFLVSRLIIQEDCGELYNIAVESRHQGQRIGEKLLLSFVNYCKHNNLKQINLEVRKSNEIALNLYRKSNFHVAGIRKNFYTNPLEDALTLTRNLSESQS